MQTQSHALIAAALVLHLRRRQINVHLPAFVLGAILPDIPLWIICHNFFHALPTNALLCALGWWICRHGQACNISTSFN